MKSPMNLQQFTTLTGLDLDTLDTDTLRRLVSAHGQTLNRRIQNIKYNPDASQIPVKYIMQSGGRFTTRSHYRKTKHGKPQPMNRKELLTEAKREINFAKKSYSTVKGAKDLKSANQRIGGGQTSKEYAKKKEQEARAKVREQIHKENRAAGRRANKYTAAQKYAMKQAGKQSYKQAKKAYDKAVSDYWEQYHQYKETNNVQGSPVEVTENVSKYVFQSDEDKQKHFEEIVKNFYLNPPEYENIEDNSPFKIKDEDPDYTKEVEEWINEAGETLFK